MTDTISSLKEAERNMPRVPSQKEIRYDRQLRLWGDHGQAALERAHVCLLNATATGTEILKSLILPGIGKFTIIDGSVATGEDVGNSFFLKVEGIGKPRGDVARRLLLEMNPDVQGEWINERPEKLSENNMSVLERFTFVIGSDLRENVLIQVSEFLWARNIPFLVARAYGLFGYIRLAVPEQTIVETHPGNALPDMRLDQPFSQLKDFVDGINLENMTSEEHGHTPYLVLLMKAVEKWRDEEGKADNDFPADYQDKLKIKQILKKMQNASAEEQNFQEAICAVNASLILTKVPPQINELLADAACSGPLAANSPNSEFWLLCRGLKRFIERTSHLPLRGSLPDMTADSARYIQLQDLFHRKAREDAELLEKLVEEIVEKSDAKLARPSSNFVRKFSRNAAFLCVIRGRSIREEFSVEGAMSDNIRYNLVERRDKLVPWYILFRATERFCSEKGRYPGTNGIPVELDNKDLRNRVKVFGEELKISEEIKEAVTDDMVTEMCRYGAAEIHPVASFIGGIAAHEIIKVITGQYIPMDNTFVYDGNTSNGAVYKF